MTVPRRLVCQYLRPVTDDSMETGFQDVEEVGPVARVFHGVMSVFMLRFGGTFFFARTRKGVVGFRI